jgi:hypothetical protein|tara:strand:- start:441 stop:1310 length:870 start_codon:yes stop_codon:yes gene_type:complete
MSRQTPISTLNRFHPAAFNPLENAEPTSNAFQKAPNTRSRLVKRETQIRRDTDTHNNFSITLYDVDFAIKRYIENIIKPYITENGRTVPVPVQYGSPEKWTSMQKLAALRDGKSKSNFPLIVYTRTNVSKNQELSKLNVFSGQERQMMDHFVNRYSQINKYDKFSALRNVEPKRERYSMVVPNFVDISYSIKIFCDYVEQINNINEAFWDHQGKAWGMEYKFMSSYSSADLETSVPSDGDRLVTSNIDLNVKAGLISKDIDLQPSTGKNITSYNIAFKTRTVNNIGDFE